MQDPQTQARVDAIVSLAPVRHLLSGLEAEGYQAFVVGGAVRNAVLGRKASDIDISTDTHPDKVSRLFGAAGHTVVPTGIEHGTVSVIIQGESFEITTFRRDVATDGRRATVAFSESIAEDAQRRDFTMNALYADVRGKIHDPTGEGLHDAGAGYLRFIGNADHRIREDALRILRYFRLSATLELKVDGSPHHAADDETRREAMSSRIGMLAQLSRERVGQEMRKLLGAPSCISALQGLATVSAMPFVVPGVHSLAAVDRLERLELASGLKPHWGRRLLALRPDMSWDPWRFSKKEADYHASMEKLIPQRMTREALGYKAGERKGIDTLLLQMAFGTPFTPEDIAAVRSGAQAVFPMRAADLPGHLRGRQIGDALKALEARWVESGFQLGVPELLRDPDELPSP